MILFHEIDSLQDADFGKVVRIRGEESTVSDALERSLAHAAYHVGQIVLLARIHVGRDWKSLSIPRGKSQEYNFEVAPNRRRRVRVTHSSSNLFERGGKC